MANTSSNFGMPSKRAPLKGEGPSLVAGAHQAKLNPDKDRKPPGAEIVKRRHPDWVTHEIGWRWMLDSFEGGQRYRDAEYGPDRFGRPLRNMIRHKREYPDQLEFPNTFQTMGMNAGSAAGVGVAAMMGPYPGMQGADPTATAQDDEYEYRRARTPVPDFVERVTRIHLGKIYDQKVSRKGTPELDQWWKNVDGGGTSIGEWMENIISPLLDVLGCIDVVIDRPALPPDVRVETKQDEIDLGLDTVVAAYILPQNMVDYDIDPAGNYTRCLVREYWSPTLDNPEDREVSDGSGFSTEFPGEPRPAVVRYRHWTAKTVTLYDENGEIVEDTRAHGYDYIPVKRLIDCPRHRTPHIGKPRNEFIAECQREYYNRNSELILNDSIQSSPLLSGPEEYCNPEKSVNVGPGNILPMKPLGDGTGYAQWVYVAPPSGPSDSIRKNLEQIIEDVDRAACLMKPAGVTGTTGGTVSQSGYSKAMDAESGNKLLSGIAKSLARNERILAEFALSCILRAPLTPAQRASIRIVYPARFQLKQAQEILNELTMLMNVVLIETQVDMATAAPASPPQTPSSTPDDQQGGNTPRLGSGKPMTPTARVMVPTLLAANFDSYARAAFPGQADEFYAQVNRETSALFHLHAFPTLGTVSDHEAMMGHGTEEAMAGEDRTGVSSATAVSPSISQVM